MSVRIRSTGATGEYQVSLIDGAAEIRETVLGTVMKRVERWNLRRPVTSTYWRAFPADRRVDDVHYPTRRDAVDALTGGNR